jgi:hypothetical protein
VFKLDKAGKLTVLHRFEASFLADGNAPEAGLLMDSAGNLYGATEGGGNSQAAADGQMCLFLGCGTIFKLAP